MHFWRGDTTKQDTVGSAHLSGAGSSGVGLIGDGLAYAGGSGDSTFGSAGGYDQGLTVEVWFNTTSTALHQVLVAQYHGGNQFDDDTFELALNDHGNRLYWQLKTQDGQAIGDFALHVPSPSPVDGQWHHLVGTYDGTTQKLYYDGQYVASAPTGGGPVLIVPSTPITVGWEEPGPPGGQWHYTGTLDEPAIYGRALSDAEIATHYTAGLAGTPIC